jgi:response regulator of citrate/malate metabolism
MIRTLVVDDDARVASVHRDYLERLDGFEVVGVVHRGTEALEAAQHGVDLVLLDLYLPDLHGLEVCRRLRARSAPVDVIVITAARDVDTVREAVAQGVVQYLIKPFTFATFRERVERYAAYRARLDRHERLDQAQVDEIMRPLRGAEARAGRELPKGLSRPTYDVVRRALGGRPEGASAEEVAEAAGVSRVTARRYLEHLVAEGLADRALRYGAAGRPEKRYREAARVRMPEGKE